MEGLSKKVTGVLATLTIFFFLTAVLKSNPMVPPKAVISELKLLEGGSWILEIGFEYGTGYSKAEYDSVFIRTSSGYSQVLLHNLPDGITEFLLTRDSLPSYLNINRSGDYIVLITYRDELDIPHTDSVSFGVLPNAMIPGVLPIDYSITRLFVYSDYFETEIPVFARDKSPTIGLPNDTVGTTGILQGHIYDKNNNPVQGDSFIMDNPLIIDSSGYYVTNYFSRRIKSHYISQNTGMFTIYLLTNNYEIDMYPDSTVILDIYLVDYVSDVSDEAPLQESEPEIINYPNPFNSSTNFVVNIPHSLEYQQAEINIYDVNGAIVFTIPVGNNTKAVWNGINNKGETAASGIYYYQLSVDSRLYKSSSMILLK